MESYILATDEKFYPFFEVKQGGRTIVIIVLAGVSGNLSCKRPILIYSAHLRSNIKIYHLKRALVGIIKGSKDR